MQYTNELHVSNFRCILTLDLVFFFMCVTCSKIVSSIVCYLVAYYHNDQIKNNYLCWNFVYHRSPFVDVILMANNKIESNKMEWDWALHIVGDLFIHSCLSLNNKDIHRFFLRKKCLFFMHFSRNFPSFFCYFLNVRFGKPIFIANE